MQGIEIDFKDGKTRRLVFGVKQASLVEKEFNNEPFLTLLGHNNLTFRFISHCIWAGLQRKNALEISHDEVCELLEGYLRKPGGNIADFLSPIVNACFDSGILRRDVEGNGTAVPNAEKETAENTSPSPRGGTTDGPQSSVTTG